jgi:hypothetical protein
METAVGGRLLASTQTLLRTERTHEVNNNNNRDTKEPTEKQRKIKKINEEELKKQRQKVK